MVSCESDRAPNAKKYGDYEKILKDAGLLNTILNAYGKDLEDYSSFQELITTWSDAYPEDAKTILSHISQEGNLIDNWQLHTQNLDGDSSAFIKSKEFYIHDKKCRIVIRHFRGKYSSNLVRSDSVY
ncbi:hypothetical protein [Rubritalea tangerina]